MPSNRYMYGVQRRGKTRLFYLIPSDRSSTILLLSKMPFHTKIRFLVDSSENHKKIERLEEVYSTSGDTVEFARNFGDYLNEKIPYTVVIVILLLLCFVAMVFLLVGMCYHFLVKDQFYGIKRSILASNTCFSIQIHFVTI